MRPLLNTARWLGAFALAYAAYLLVAAVIHAWLRGLADNVNGDRTHSLVPLSQTLLGGVMAQRLQELIGTNHPFMTELSFHVWFSLFWMTPLLALLAFLLGGLRTMLSLLAVHAVVVFSSDAIFALFPTRPPWMDVEVTRVIAVEAPGLTDSDTNPYASLPSLHVAVPAAYAMWFWRNADARLRRLGPLLAAWTAAMAFTVVYTGEHYTFCVALGVLMAIGANLALQRVHVRGMRPWAPAQALAKVEPPDRNLQAGDFAPVRAQ